MCLKFRIRHQTSLSTYRNYQKQHNMDLMLKKKQNKTLFKLTWPFVVNYLHSPLRTSKAWPTKGFPRPFRPGLYVKRTQAAGCYKDSRIMTEGRYLRVIILHRHLHPLMVTGSKDWEAGHQGLASVSCQLPLCTSARCSSLAQEETRFEGNGHSDYELIVISSLFCFN